MSKDKKDKEKEWSDFCKLEDWLPTIIAVVITMTLRWSLSIDEFESAFGWLLPCSVATIFWGWYKVHSRRRKIAKNGEEDYKVFITRFWFYLFMIFVPLLFYIIFAGRLHHTLANLWYLLYIFLVMFGMQYIAKKIFPYSDEKEKDKKE